MAAILRSRRNFLPEVKLEFEYATKIAMIICDILSFWSMLWLKYWQSYCSSNFWPILEPYDVINDIIHDRL